MLKVYNIEQRFIPPADNTIGSVFASMHNNGSPVS